MNEGRLRIGIVCLPSLGGSGIVAAGLAEGLAGRGHRVHLIATQPPGRSEASQPGLSFEKIAAPNYPLFDQPQYELAVASAIVRVAREHGLDLVNAHYGVPHAASAYLARQVLGADAPRFVTTLHGTDVTHVGADPSYLAVTRFTVAASDLVTVPSRYLAAAARTNLGLDESVPIDVAENFVDTEAFAPAPARDPEIFRGLFEGPEQGPVLFHVSNFRPVKRTPDLIEVLARVRKQIPARLVLVGDGIDRAAAEARVQTLGLSSSVAFLGMRTDFARQLAHADLFLLTSEAESFGLAALEAMSAGVPVLGYAVGGLPEVVTDEVGVLVAPLDVDALASATLSLLRDPSRCQQMRAAARARAVERFRREPALDRYEACFRRALTGAREVSS